MAEAREQWRRTQPELQGRLIFLDEAGARTDMTYDPAVSSATVAAIWALWRKRPGNIVIPGHDIPMALKDGQPQYLAKREDAIKAWFGDDIDTMTTLELSVR